MWKYDNPPSPNELFHYSSKYYDPVKAHEYYMRRRELKGQTKKASITEVPTDKASKGSIKPSPKNGIKTRTVRATATDHHMEIRRDIDNLRTKFNRMSEEERTQKKNEMINEIRRLRLKNQAERDRISQNQSSASVKHVGNTE